MFFSDDHLFNGHCYSSVLYVVHTFVRDNTIKQWVDKFEVVWKVCSIMY